MSRDEASRRSWTLRVTTGLPTTSMGQSHSWVTPTSSSPRPMAQTISVADGRSETMRIQDVVLPPSTANWLSRPEA